MRCTHLQLTCPAPKCRPASFKEALAQLVGMRVQLGGTTRGEDIPAKPLLAAVAAAGVRTNNCGQEDPSEERMWRPADPKQLLSILICGVATVQALAVRLDKCQQATSSSRWIHRRKPQDQ